MKAYYLPRHDTKKTPVRSRLYTHLGPAATEALRQHEALLDKKYSAIGKPSRSLLLQVALLRFSANVQHDPAELRALWPELRAHAAAERSVSGRSLDMILITNPFYLRGICSQVPDLRKCDHHMSPGGLNHDIQGNHLH